LGRRLALAGTALKALCCMSKCCRVRSQCHLA
jgi:hypothetical protein